MTNRLNEKLEPTLQRIENAVRQCVAPGHIEVGGGSVLEALWKHRESTDIDLFTTRDTIRQWAETGLLRQIGQALAESGANIEVCNSEAQWLKGDLEGTGWSLGGSAWASQPRGAEAGEEIRGMDKEAIISAKLFGRIAAMPVGRFGYAPAQLKLRDGYDLAVIPACEPGLLDRALARGSAEEQHRVWVSLDATDTVALKKDPQKLIRPQYDVNMDRVALTLAHAVAGGRERSMPVPALKRGRRERQRRGVER